MDNDQERDFLEEAENQRLMHEECEGCDACEPDNYVGTHRVEIEDESDELDEPIGYAEFYYGVVPIYEYDLD